MTCCQRAQEQESTEIDSKQNKAFSGLYRRSALLALTPLPSVSITPAFALAGSPLTNSVPYVVSTDVSLPLADRVPKLQKIDVEAALQDVAAPEVRAVFLGEHHDSVKDHELQAEIIRALAARRPVAVGLEAVQRRFQPVLDAYVSGKLTEAELEKQTDWRVRWFWPFDRYLPVFRACRELQLPILALNVDSEDLSQVEVGGLSSVDEGTFRSYISDPKAFSDSMRTVAFRAYADRVIKPSYDMHKEMGILRTTLTGQTLPEDMPYRNFLSGRLLWDTCMGSRAATWLKEAKPESLVIGLIGGDHVKFGCGVPARCAQALGSPLSAVRGIMLNTTPGDTADMKYGQALGSAITLQMPFAAPGATKDVDAATAMRQAKALPVLPVADLLWYSA